MGKVAKAPEIVPLSWKW